jgi:hypothetical protein
MQDKESRFEGCVVFWVYINEKEGMENGQDRQRFRRHS